VWSVSPTKSLSSQLVRNPNSTLLSWWRNSRISH
jgi:hypothetical protein